MTDTLPTVPNATLLRFMAAKGVNVEAIRAHIAKAAGEIGNGNAVAVELEGIALVVDRGCVFLAEKPTVKLKVEPGKVV